MAKLAIKNIDNIKGRILFIGDVHGCKIELETLLKKFSPTSKDMIIGLGDLINKGPDSRGVLNLINRYKIQCIQGNHERRLLRSFEANKRKGLKPSDAYTLGHLHRKVWKSIAKWPQAIHLTEQKIICIHGGFLPDEPWHKTDPEVATTVQVITSDGLPGKRSKNPVARPWADFWNGSEKVLYGHTPREEVLRHDSAIGLDTSCVYGGKLTGWVYPEDNFIEVAAKKDYTARWN